MEWLFLLGEMEKIKSPKQQYDAVNGADKNGSSLTTEQCTSDNVVRDDVSFPSEVDEGVELPPIFHNAEVKSNIGLLPLTVLVFYK